MTTTYHRPATLDEAVRLRAAGPMTVLAGATDVYPARVAKRAWGEPVTGDILDISAIDALRGIAVADDHVRIGALATWTDVIRAELPPLCWGLQHAARHVGGVQVQNRGTVVGNACTASPAGDGIPNLLALDAVFDLASVQGTRTVPARDFFAGYRTTALRTDEIVTAIRVPLRPGEGQFRKLGARQYLVISIAMVALVIDTTGDGRIRSARIAVGACAATAQRLPALESDLAGVPAEEAVRQVHPDHFTVLSPIDDVRASAAYRLAAARELVRDGLANVARSTVRAA